MDEKERSRTLTLTLSQIEKQFGKGSILRLGAKEAIVPVSVISSGSISLENAIDHQGEVTLAIPGHGNGFGKMMLSIQGRTIEIEAYTPGDTIRRGTRVRVVRVQDRNMLFVEPIITINP